MSAVTRLRGPGRLYIDGAVSALQRERGIPIRALKRSSSSSNKGHNCLYYILETHVSKWRSVPWFLLPDGGGRNRARASPGVRRQWRTTAIGMGRRRLAERAANPARRPGGGAFVRQGVKRRRVGAERWRVRRMPLSGLRGGCPSKLSAAGCMTPPWDASVDPPPRQRLARRLVGD